MKLSMGEIFVQVNAKTDGLMRAERDTKKFARNTEKQFERTSRAASKTTATISRLGKAMAGLAALEAARRVVLLTDSYNVLQQRILTATKATGDYVRVSKELFEISNKNGTSLRTNVELFQSLARVAPELGASTSQMLTLTKTVGQLGVIGGSSAEQMKNGLLQFTQGLAAGVLRAEEMNSILENIPEVANRIAKGMNLTVGGLRKAVLAGEVLSENVFQALLKQAPEIAKEFETIPSSVERSATALMNSFTKFLGQLDKATGVTNGLSIIMSGLATFLNDIATPIVITIGKGIKVIVNTLIDVVKKLEKATGIAKLLTGAFRDAIDFISNMTFSIEVFSLKFQIAWEKIKQAGASAANFVQMAWARTADSTLKFFADSIGGIGGLLKIDGMQNLAKELEATANSEAKVADAISVSNMARAEKIEGLKQEILRIKEKERAQASALLLEQNNAMAKEAEQLQAHEKNLAEIRAKALAEKSKLEATEAFLGVDITKKAGDLQLKEQGLIFKSQIDQAAQYSREFFEIKKAMALSTALIEAPKAILSSFTFGSELGGPILGAAFAGIAAAATAVQVSAISSSQFRSGKATGGNVFNGGMYKVNENGPEMLSVGGEDFLMMGNKSGTVTSNDALKGGKGKVTVNVYPQAGETANVQSRTTQDGESIDIFIEKVTDTMANKISEGGNSLSDAIEQQFGLSRVPGTV